MRGLGQAPRAGCAGGCSSAGERLLCMQEALGSTPSISMAFSPSETHSLPGHHWRMRPVGACPVVRFSAGPGFFPSHRSIPLDAPFSQPRHVQVLGLPRDSGTLQIAPHQSGGDIFSLEPVPRAKPGCPHPKRCIRGCDGRGVKALDLKSNRVSLRRFESCSQRWILPTAGV